MIRLKNTHRGDRAVVILGGPSLLAQGFDFGRLQGRGSVTFLETKSLTPGLIHTGFVPDYFLMLSPDKAKDNSLQHVVFQSFLAEYRVDSLLKAAGRQVAADLRASF